MASRMKLLWTSVLLLLGSRLAQGLDVELESITCDESLQVTASLYMQCAEGGSRCTFGNSTTLTGTSKSSLVVWLTASGTYAA